ncbi:MAG: GntR family transcriptional regulator, partial [Chitinophagales bacterium]
MLDLQSPLPLYVQLREIIRKKIEGGSWAIGEQIPGEHDLVNQYGVARATVRQAIMDLVNEGLLYRKQGKGTFVCRARRQDTIEPLVSFTAEMTARGLTPGAVVLQIGDAQSLPENVAYVMGIKTNILYLERLRTANNITIAMEYSYLRKDHVKGLTEEDLSASLYQLLVYKLNVDIRRV